MEKQFHTTTYGTVTEVKVEGDYNVVLTNVSGNVLTIDMKDHRQLQLFIAEFLKHIQDLPQQVQAILEKLIPKLPKNLTYIPDNLTDYFIGRGTDIDKVHNLLTTDGRAVLVNGMGGIGKSALAQEYIRLKKDSYNHIAYVKVLSEFDDKNQYQANNEDALFEAFANHPNLSKNLGLEFDEKTPAKRQFAQILSKLNEIEGTNLLIIDNASDEIAKYRELLPNKQHWKILLTSRQQIVHLQPYILGVLEGNDAKQLFYNYYTVEQDDENLERILAFIGYHTLTIELLAKQAQERYISILALIEMLEKNGISIPKRAKVAPLSSHKTQTTIKHLLESFIIDLDKEGIQLLRYFSILPSTLISYNDLMDYLKIPSDLDNFFFNALKKLKLKGWVNQSQGSYVCHQVIQEVIRKKLKPNTKKCERIINSFSDKLYIDVIEGEHGAFKKKYIPFAESILKHIKDKNKQIGFLTYRLGSAIAENGDYNRSIAIYEKVEKIYDGIIPEYSYEMSNLCNSIGVSFRHQNEYEKSIAYFQKSIKIKEKLIEGGDKEEEPRISVSYQNLAVAYRYNKQYDLCIESFQKAIDILEQYGDEYLLALAAFYMNTGSAYRHIKNYEKSVDYLEKSIKIYEDKVGFDHPDLATAHNNLAYVYSDLDELEKNLEYTLKTVRIYEQHLEPTHPYLLISYSNLALAYFDNNRFEEAKPYIDHVVDVRKKTLSVDDVDLINVLNWQMKINNMLKTIL